MKSAITFLAIIISFGLNAQKVNWMSWDEAVEANKQNPKLIFVDVYTDWCGWCKKMDASTFGNPVIAKYMSENYYAIKFNAEGKDTINFAGNTFVNQNPDASRSTHQFARALLDNQMGYPKFVVFNNKIERMSIIPGYHTAKDFEPMLKFFGEQKNFELSFDEFKASFKGEVN